MLTALRQNKLLAGMVFFAGLFIGAIIQPVWKLAIIFVAQSQYSEITFKCDHVMREHFFAKQVVHYQPSTETVQALEAAETALIDCQDYDLLRKNLILWGLSENDLALMSLQAIEERATSLQSVVEIHEIRY